MTPVKTPRVNFVRSEAKGFSRSNFSAICRASRSSSCRALAVCHSQRSSKASSSSWSLRKLRWKFCMKSFSNSPEPNPRGEGNVGWCHPDLKRQKCKVIKAESKHFPIKTITKTTTFTQWLLLLFNSSGISLQVHVWLCCSIQEINCSRLMDENSPFFLRANWAVACLPAASLLWPLKAA